MKARYRRGPYAQDALTHTKIRSLKPRPTLSGRRYGGPLPGDSTNGCARMALRVAVPRQGKDAARRRLPLYVTPVCRRVRDRQHELLVQGTSPRDVRRQDSIMCSSGESIPSSEPAKLIPERDVLIKQKRQCGRYGIGMDGCQRCCRGGRAVGVGVARVRGRDLIRAHALRKRNG